MSTSLGETFEAVTMKFARALAHRHKLVDDDGTVQCWTCGARRALMPQLHCAVCLAAAYRARGGLVAGTVQNREQTDADRAFMRFETPQPTTTASPEDDGR